MAAPAPVHGPPQINGDTLEEVKRAVQFWMQNIVDRLNALETARTPQTTTPVVTRENG